jgi:hypothetical protein
LIYINLCPEAGISHSRTGEGASDNDYDDDSGTRLDIIPGSRRPFLWSVIAMHGRPISGTGRRRIEWRRLIFVALETGVRRRC